MVVSLPTPTDVINAALKRIGYKLRIGSLFDGSEAAKFALDIYGQTRDELLRDTDWGFAENNVILTLLKQAPQYGYVPPIVWSTAYPPVPWIYEYSYPSDCIKVRAVKPTPILLPDFDPSYNIFSISEDTSYTPSVKVILCNVPNALLVYTARVTNPLVWDVGFTETFVAALGRRLAPCLSSLDTEKLEGQDEVATYANTSTIKG